MADTGLFYVIGVVIIVLGVLVIVYALGRSGSSKEREGEAEQERESGRVKGGGVIIIGPVPIVFGSDKKTVRSLLILAIVLMVLVLAVTVVWNFLLR